MKKRPNILLIMADNHPAEVLGCYGNPEVQTPNIDRLAKEGVQFNQAYAVNAMCSPCRASVLTGLLPSQHGIHTWIDGRKMDSWPQNWNALEQIDTLPELLQQNGYHTALVGKYHLGDPFQPQNGFEHWVTFPHGHTRSFWGNTIIDNGEQYVYEGHSVDCFTEKAVEYLEAYAEDEPFFLCLTYNGPYGHWPAIKGKPKNRFADLYADTPMQSLPREGLDKSVIERFLLRMDESGDGLDYSAPLQILNDLESMRNYFSQMSMVDDGVGRVLATLDAQGLAEETLVIYTTDHGFCMGQHGFWGHAQATMPSNAYASAYCIPLVMRGAGLTAHSDCDRLVSQLDIFPTVLDAAGVEPPSNLPARNLRPLLVDDSADWEDMIFIEQEETRALRTSRWLYVKRFKGNADVPLADELYDLQADPEEKVNVIEQHAGIVPILDDKLTAFFDQHANPDFDLWRGGVVKSNSDKPWLWQGAWGQSWQPVF